MQNRHTCTDIMYNRMNAEHAYIETQEIQTVNMKVRMISPTLWTNARGSMFHTLPRVHRLHAHTSTNAQPTCKHRHKRTRAHRLHAHPSPNTQHTKVRKHTHKQTLNIRTRIAQLQQTHESIYYRSGASYKLTNK